MTDQPRPRVAIVTNGNYFANLALAPLLEHAVGWDFLVVLTTGLRRPGTNRHREALSLLRRWGWRYGAFKLTSYFLPLVVERVRHRPQLVAATCRRLGVPTLVMRSVNHPDAVAALASFHPDLLVSVSCPYRIERTVLEIPDIGSINLHSSLLPRYAGVSTYVHVLAEGEPQAGVTVHEMVERFDAGQILAQEAITIDAPTSAFRLFSMLCELSVPLLHRSIDDALAKRRLAGSTQDLSSRSYRQEPGPAEVSALRAQGHRLLTLGDVASLLGTGVGHSI